MQINPLRGESKLVIAGNTYVLAMTMESLAQLSGLLGDPPFQDLYDRLMRGALGAQRAALGVFVQSGITATGKALGRREAIAAALRDVALSDLGAWSQAMVPLLNAVTRTASDEPADEGNATAAQT